MKYCKLFLGIFFGLLVGMSVLADVRNGDMKRRDAKTMAQYIDVNKLREKGWKCPELENWPLWWTALGNGVDFQYHGSGGVAGGPYAEISGNKGFLMAYEGNELKKQNYVLSFWAKGKGTLLTSFAFSIHYLHNQFCGLHAKRPGNRWNSASCSNRNRPGLGRMDIFQNVDEKQT